MNRSLLLVFVVSTIAAAQPIHGFVEKQVAYTGGAYKDEVFRYRLRSPSTVEKGKRYPLVFFLHGAGERGDDNEKRMRHFPELWGKSEYAKAFDCFVLAPQCRVDKRWVEVPWGDGAVFAATQGTVTPDARRLAGLRGDAEGVPD